MNKKDFAFSIKGEPDESGLFEGYASTFGGAPDSYGDIITPGAFAKSLVAHKRAGTMPMMFFGHNSNELPSGDWVDMAEDGKGLWMQGRPAMDDPFGVRVYGALKSKRVRGLSIGYNTIRSHPDEKLQGVTHLDEIDLVEVSIVNRGANKRSLITDVKADESLFETVDQIRKHFRSGENPPLPLIEKLLRDAEFPNALATAFVSAGKSAFRHGDHGDEAKKAADFLKALRG